LPEPVFTYTASGITIEFKKDIYYKEYLETLELNSRQQDALLFFKTAGLITTSAYLKKYNVTDRTARRDLAELTKKKLLNKQGEKKTTHYTFRSNVR